MEGIHKIMTHLWFDKEAAEAGEFYLSVFENSRLLSRRILSGTPSGDVETLTLEIEDINLMLLSAGPYFKVNPSISFMVSCATKDEARKYWAALSEGGEALMPFDTYDFSELYGWIQDKFGVSWQVMVVGDAPIRAKIRPAMMFVGKNAGHAEEALGYYTSLFKNSEIVSISRYGKGFEPNDPEHINFAEFVLEGKRFSIMDSVFEHDFDFNEAISFIINCDTQEEIDYYWENLSADPAAEQCGWLKDKYGVSWQVTPTVMNDMIDEADPVTLERVTKAFLAMHKFDLEALNKAYRGEE